MGATDPYIKENGTIRTVGTFQADSMRRITGSVVNIGQYGKIETQNGALSYKSTGKSTLTESGGSSHGTIAFDSSYGVEGKLGEQSSNVQSENCPVNMAVNFYIYAKIN